MKPTLRIFYFFIVLILVLPQLTFGQSDKRIMEHVCDTRPALKEILLSAGVSATLMGCGPYTFFAPSDDALAALHGSDPARLNSILMNHILPGKVLTQDLKEGTKINTLGGAQLSVFRKGDKVLINGVEITDADQVVRNGAVHTVRGLLVAPDVKTAGLGQLR